MEKEELEKLIKQYISDNLVLWLDKSGDVITIELTIDGDLVDRASISL